MVFEHKEAKGESSVALPLVPGSTVGVCGTERGHIHRTILYHVRLVAVVPSFFEDGIGHIRKRLRTASISTS